MVLQARWYRVLNQTSLCQLTQQSPWQDGNDGTKKSKLERVALKQLCQYLAKSDLRLRLLITSNLWPRESEDN